jgi:hypothetical protein
MNRRFAVILGLMTATCATSGFVACSSSNSGGGGGEDAGTDHSATGDSTAPDSNPGMDSSTKDSTASETGNDTGTPAEGGTGEGGADASDGGTCTVYDASGLNEASVQAGFTQVWQVYKCWRCHQNTTLNPVDDAGNGILLSGNVAGLGDSGLVFPPNLTNSAVALGCWTDPQIQTAMLQGLDLEGGALCPPMPVFGVGDGGGGKPMDAGTAQEIIDYLRSITPSNQLTTDTTCPAATDGGTTDGASDAPQDAPDAG